MTYPKMKTENVVFVAEKTNVEFERWMPLYEPNVKPSVWEDAAESEEAMMEAIVARTLTFSDEDSITGMLLGISYGIAMTKLAQGDLGTTMKEVGSHVDDILIEAGKIGIKAGHRSLRDATIAFTQKEWKQITPQCPVDERWVRREADKLRMMTEDWLKDQIGDLLWHETPTSLKNGIDG